MKKAILVPTQNFFLGVGAVFRCCFTVEWSEEWGEFSFIDSAATATACAPWPHRPQPIKLWMPSRRCQAVIASSIKGELASTTDGLALIPFVQIKNEDRCSRNSIRHDYYNCPATGNIRWRNNSKWNPVFPKSHGDSRAPPSIMTKLASWGSDLLRRVCESHRPSLELHYLSKKQRPPLRQCKQLPN